MTSLIRARNALLVIAMAGALALTGCGRDPGQPSGPGPVVTVEPRFGDEDANWRPVTRIVCWQGHRTPHRCW